MTSRPEKTSRLSLRPHGPFIDAPSRRVYPGGTPSCPQPLGQKLLDYPTALPEQPLQVQHARTRLALVPRWVEPPTVSLRLLQTELQQPQQRHRQQLCLRRPHDRRLGPGSALLPAQTLLQVPEPVLLAEAGTEQFQQLQPAQFRGAADQGEALLVALDLGHHRLDRQRGPGHAPQTHHLLVAHLTPAPVQPSPALLPAARPAAAASRRVQ